MTTYNFNIGATVHCKDGQCGKLAKVVVDPETLRVVHLIVEEGFLLKSARAFPIDTVQRTGENDVYLSIYSDTVNKYPEFVESEYERPATDWQGAVDYHTQDILFAPTGSVYDLGVVSVKEKVRHGIPDGLEVVESGTEVRNAEGVIGKLDHIMSDQASNVVTHLLVRQGLIFTEQLKIPITFVERVGEDGIFVQISNDDLAHFSYDADANHDSASAREDARNAQRDNGDNILTGESEIATAVSSALLEDKRTTDCAIEVINERGIVTLTGNVATQEQREAAHEIAANCENVISVTNSLKVIDPDNDADIDAIDGEEELIVVAPPANQF